MGDFLYLLLPIIGFPIILLAIISPFWALWYQNKRNYFFKKLAEEYKLKYTQNYPYKTFLWQTLLANPPVAARVIEGPVNGTEIKIGDYIMSVYWWSRIGYMTSRLQTRFYKNGREQEVALPIFWKLASENKVSAFLKDL